MLHITYYVYHTYKGTLASAMKERIASARPFKRSWWGGCGTGRVRVYYTESAGYAHVHTLMAV